MRHANPALAFVLVSGGCCKVRSWTKTEGGSGLTGLSDGEQLLVPGGDEGIAPRLECQVHHSG